MLLALPKLCSPFTFLLPLSPRSKKNVGRDQRSSRRWHPRSQGIMAGSDAWLITILVALSLDSCITTHHVYQSGRDTPWHSVRRGIWSFRCFVGIHQVCSYRRLSEYGYMPIERKLNLVNVTDWPGLRRVSWNRDLTCRSACRRVTLSQRTWQAWHLVSPHGRHVYGIDWPSSISRVMNWIMWQLGGYFQSCARFVICDMWFVQRHLISDQKYGKWSL